MKYSIIILLLAVSCMIQSCEKYLDKAPGKALVIPQAIDELQAVLDHHGYMNSRLPSLGEISSDDYFVTANNYNAYHRQLDKNAYIWETDIYQGDKGAYINDWTMPYRVVFYANVALEGINKIKPTAAEQTVWNNVKGSALFFRAFGFFQVANLYSTSYDLKTATTDLGIPLRLDPGIDEPSARSTVAATYNQMLEDLHAAYPLLPIDPVAKTRPSKPAAFALLAKIYLIMQDYPKALQYADSCLFYKQELMDFNTLNLALLNPFPPFNKEVLFHATLDLSNFVYSSARRIDTAFYDLFDGDDLRVPVYFRSTTTGYRLKASYDASEGYEFGGLAVDEVYLIKAECAVRQGLIELANATLNKLLHSRYQTNTFSEYDVNDKDNLLALILRERRKELFTRNVRWSDIRRLNKDPQTAIRLSRTVNDVTYTLNPNDPRYSFPIPPYVMDLTGMTQNER